MIKPSIKYAIICGIFLLGLFALVGTAMMDMKHSFFDTIIMAVFIVFAIKEFKKYHNNEILHFWQGMSISFVVYGIATLLFCLVITVLYSLDSGWLEGYISDMTAQLIKQRENFPDKITEQELNQKIEETKQTTNFLLIADSFLRKLFAGFFVSPIISIILRRKPI